MKSITGKLVVLLAISTVLFSFVTRPGGEGFEIYLNNKVVLQQYGNEMNTVKKLPLDQYAATDNLGIRYYHCGKAGKNRVITIRDAQNNSLKEYRYADVTTPASAMIVPVKDLLGLKKKTGSNLQLYYSSSELPKGRVLVSVAP
ncbi:MAG: hypothetical protein ABIT05_10590 [Chitinophagaceae bacterium]